MKKSLLMSALALSMGFVMASCGGSSQNEKAGGLPLSNLDTKAVPGTDFFQFACGGWKEAHPLTDEYPQYGSFTVLAENNIKQIRGIIEEMAATEHEAGTIEQKIGDLYRMVMDTTKLNADGITPLKGELAEIDGMNRKEDVYSVLADLQRKGISGYLVTYVAADQKNSDENAVQVSQSGLSMGDRDYYLSEDEEKTRVRKAFRKYVADMFQLAGYDETAAAKNMELVMNIETRLAKAFTSRVDLRNPYANYNKMSMAQVKKTYPTFDWDAYLTSYGLNGVQEMIIGQTKALAEAAAILNETSLDDQKTYLKWKLINAAAGSLSKDFYDLQFDFYSRTMSGVKEQQPRWKKAVGEVDAALGEAVGQIYVEKYFPAEAKERMVTLVRNLQKSLGERIQANTWMGDETKARALDKLAAFHVKIGYPDTWKDYSTLEIKNDSYWQNSVRANWWSHLDMISDFGKPVDKDEWQMTPQTVNAYYNPTTNEVCFPAGILQPPFFDMEADDAFNYGAIGVVIGHEMTHGFDDQGRQYNKEGNLEDWWTPEDAKRFDERAQVMVDFFDAIEVAPGLHANGRMTLGENIADHGGLQISYQAFKKATADAPLETIAGFTPEQRFFLAYAGVWANNTRPEYINYLTTNDVHSMGEWRVNGALPQINAWYEAFNITESDPLYLPVEKRVSIW